MATRPPTALNEHHPDLQQFRGSLTRYKDEWILLTPGSMYVMNQYEAWWLLDLIKAMQLDLPVRGMYTQIWRLECSADGRATVTCADGDYRVCWRQDVMTDFPSPGIEVWVEDLVLHLPNEH